MVHCFENQTVIAWIMSFYTSLVKKFVLLEDEYNRRKRTLHDWERQQKIKGCRGVVAFVGVVHEIGGGGHWVGIKFDEPVGKTDGTAGSKHYFEASPGFGAFVHGKNVQVSDFPECGILDKLDDSEDEL